MNPSPPGQRSIDSRLAPKPVTSRKSDRKAGEDSSTPKMTRAAVTSEKDTRIQPLPLPLRKKVR